MPLLEKKVEEINHLVDELEVDLVVFYQSLTGSMGEKSE